MKKLMTTALCAISCALLAAACGGSGKPAGNDTKKGGGGGGDDTARLPVPEEFQSKTAPDLTSADLIAKGKALYEDPGKGNCVMCHGESGKGDTDLAKNYTDPVVADLTNVAMHDAVSDQYIFWRIKVPEKSKANPKSAMVGYAGGSDEEIWAMVAYVRSLKGK